MGNRNQRNDRKSLKNLVNQNDFFELALGLDEGVDGDRFIQLLLRLENGSKGLSSSWLVLAIGESDSPPLDSAEEKGGLGGELTTLTLSEGRMRMSGSSRAFLSKNSEVKSLRLGEHCSGCLRLVVVCVRSKKSDWSLDIRGRGGG